ncbi:MAG: hypothetical protein EO766_11770 [Hydrotalea sp. AMD]|uniref:NUMOD3 domain-containing DNA-binding protein n=1 Tax=Hydrotalea sp. AMD TaxID=2501297 RepID=UPI00102769DD|nr:NUMOD3 domain-containing DNA-binding protein [Hydrotalea sp. AMD]RWZ87202.1 MAG: hypothetical protein EO766_11770 [Hydrotalea sp. AMD]
MYLIYKFTSPSGKSYIGQTNNLIKRQQAHININSKCSAIRNAIQKYGWENFTVEILVENISLDEANILEENLIKEHNTLYPNGYNLRTGGLNQLFSDYTKQKLSEAHTGKILSEEHKQKISIAGRGKKRSDITKSNISRAKTGVKHTKETRMNMSKSHQNISDETRQKMSKVRLGKKQTLETRQKRSDALKGKARSDDTKLKIANSKKGTKLVIDPLTGKRTYVKKETIG